MQFNPYANSFFFIKGPVGNLEAILEQPKTPPQNIVGIVCHPHPLYEGTMHNKVVSTIVRAFLQLGVTTIRFNFRGVGKSEGSYAKGVGEVEDLLAVIRWAQAEFPENKIWLAGFSFGSYVAASAATSIQPAQLLLIAPPVHHFDFAHLPEMKYPCIVIQGEEDEVVPPKAVFDWINNLKTPPKLIRLPHVGHFFHGQLIPLRDLIVGEFSNSR
jgi:alpha/beta superfamily hydrolase